MKMLRRPIFIFTVAIGVLVLIYGGSGLRLAYLAKEIKSSGQEVTQLLSERKPNAETLKLKIGKLSSSVARAEGAMSSPIWKPIIWLSGKSDRFAEIKKQVTEASSLLSIAPGLLGIESPRKYLIVFQNPAEARGVGGIIGGYATVEVRNAKIKTLRVGSNSDLQSMKTMPIKISKEFDRLYGVDPAIWQNSNVSPHFPYGAKIWLALWKNQFRENLDGVITVDPIALSVILRVIGPVTMPDGQVITSKNVVEETLSTVYKRFEKDNIARKNYLAILARIVLQKLSADSYSKTELAKKLLTPIEEGRILFYSTNAAEQRVIEKTLVDGVLEDKPNDEYRAIIINTAGNKMDYYLERKVVIQSDSCSPVRRTTIAVSVTNTVNPFAKLPSYVVGRLDLKRPDGVGNSHGIALLIYGPTEGQLVFASSALKDQSIFSNRTERNRPVLVAHLDLQPGKPLTVKAQFLGGAGPLTFVDQPLVRKTESSIFDLCKK